MPEDNPMTLEELNRLALETFDEARNANAKDKIKLLKKAAFYAIEASEKDDIPAEYLERYIEILTVAAEIHSFPQEYHKQIGRMKSMMHPGEKSTLEEVARKTWFVQTDTATIVLGDKTSKLSLDAGSDEELINLMNKGVVFAYSIGADGTYLTQVRVLAGGEPTLAYEEQEGVVGGTETVKITINSGNVVLSALENFPNEGSNLEIQISPGIYKVCGYEVELDDGTDGYIVVLSPTDEHAENDLKRIPTISA